MRLMKLTAQVKLQPTPDQANALKRTLAQANAACNYVSAVAWERHTFGQYKLHGLVYREVRDRFGLSAQVTVRCEAKVADAYKLDRKTKRTFKPTGSIAYDDRILSWNLAKSTVSIWTTAGRMTIPFVGGERQRKLLQTRQGESDLVLRGNAFYLYATCNVEEPPAIEAQDALGIDLGIVNIATDSDGESFSGAKVEENRRKFAHRRRNLQRKGTRAATRKLRKLSGRQSRFQSGVNHVISKQVVEKAKDTNRAVALEDLEGIRERTTVRKAQRARHANWSFYQLRQHLMYKAQRAGVPVILVDPRHTSQACSVCGCIDKRNRPDQATFKCTACGHADSADHNAARNIRARAVVKQPMVASCVAREHDSVTSYPL